MPIRATFPVAARAAGPSLLTDPLFGAPIPYEVKPIDRIIGEIPPKAQILTSRRGGAR